MTESEIIRIAEEHNLDILHILFSEELGENGMTEHHESRIPKKEGITE